MTTSRLLTLVRHAKSSWKSDARTDHDRPLNKRGRRDAPDMGSRLNKAGVIPDIVLCSSAIRTQETARLLLPKLYAASWQQCQQRLIVDEQLYESTPGELLESLRLVGPEPTHVMIIAHNPGMEMLAGLLYDSPVVMPTCAVFSFELADTDGWQLARHTRRRLLFHDYPKSNLSV